MLRIALGRLVGALIVGLASGCSEDSGERPTQAAEGAGGRIALVETSGPSTSFAAIGGDRPRAAASAGASTPAAAGGNAAPTPQPPMASAAVAGSTATATGSAAGAGATPSRPMAPAGPEDGDPSAPVIGIADLPCGAGAGGAANVTIGGRGVHVAYPCDKHTGAPVTFILNLHGTMPTEELKLYQVGYFAANTLVDSHAFITVAPKAIGSQWGNMDMGLDEPHLMEVIDWTYTTFKDFDIRALWVGGHSWGAAYTARFGCKPELADRVKGLILMSGGDSAPCQASISLIVTSAEGDGRMPGDQTPIATSHGCEPAVSEMILMNTHTSWRQCEPGFVHANYYMLGKDHATFMDAEVVTSIADWIKLARP